MRIHYFCMVLPWFGRDVWHLVSLEGFPEIACRSYDVAARRPLLVNNCGAILHTSAVSTITLSTKNVSGPNTQLSETQWSKCTVASFHIGGLNELVHIVSLPPFTWSTKDCAGVQASLDCRYLSRVQLLLVCSSCPAVHHLIRDKLISCAKKTCQEPC